MQHMGPTDKNLMKAEPAVNNRNILSSCADVQHEVFGIRDEPSHAEFSPERLNFLINSFQAINRDS